MDRDAIHIRLSDEALNELMRCESKEERGRCLLRHIDSKLEAFNRWCEENLEGPVAKFEMAILRTFLYREATGEAKGIGSIEDLPRVKINDHPALSQQ
jgi:hypothetical protein